MTSAEDIRMLGKTIEAVRDTQKRRLAEVQAETQANIDKYETRLAETALETIKRYHQFKLALWIAGDRIVSDPLVNVAKVNPETLVFDSMYEPNRQIVFKDVSNDDYSSGSYFPMPLAYFDDPDKWEKELFEWLENVNLMVVKAPSVIFQDCTYRANTFGLPYPGDYFHLREKNQEGKFSASYTVEYYTGNVYDSSWKAIEAGTANPIGGLK